MGVWALSIACRAPLINESRAELALGLSSGGDVLPEGRLRSGVWLGAGVSGGRVTLSAPQASVQARVDLMPALLLGADLWTSEEYGLIVRGSFGLSAQLSLPPEYAGQELSFRQSHLLVGALRRWHLSERPDALTISAGLGLRAQREDTPPQRPTYLVTRTALGPAALLALMVPLSESLWLNARGSASTHLLVREEPADSGLLSSSLAWEAAIELCLRLSPTLALAIDAEWRRDDVSFKGFGTRALGVYEAEASQYFWTTGAALRVALR